MTRTNRTRRRSGVVTATMVVLAGLAGPGGALAGPAASASASVSAPAAAPAAVAEDPQGDGRLVVSYDPGETEADGQAEAFLEDRQVLEDVADYATARIALPQDIPLRAASCGEANAYWDPDTQSITLCYELIEELDPLFAAQNTTGTPDEQSEAVAQDLVGFTNGTLLHELGHGLVDLYHLPITGREEDAVDQLAMLLLADDVEHKAYAVSTINAWAALASAEEEGQRPIEAYADQHSLDAQRYYNWVCWLYGSAPDEYADVVETAQSPDGVLPEDRAQQCPAEFQSINESWSTLLRPYLKV
ncbi:DUF4344 domain-containing metallopeptidase [Kitasatospora sp. NPDC127111]|uniref:DUF4344 domain-containing metallopeptidase n=1 Tax=Kitasatospora sp. NPDC127111 TaxID=3345363 RepID=UPI003633500A